MNRHNLAGRGDDGFVPAATKHTNFRMLCVHINQISFAFLSFFSNFVVGFTYSVLLFFFSLEAPTEKY